jgi:hypothetical protein
VKLREIVSRYAKARFISWINTSQHPVLLPTMDGSGCVLAVFQNGKYIAPQIVQIPNGIPENWGPDGPINPPAPPEGGPDGDHPANGDNG